MPASSFCVAFGRANSGCCVEGGVGTLSTSGIDDHSLNEVGVVVTFISDNDHDVGLHTDLLGGVSHPTKARHAIQERCLVLVQGITRSLSEPRKSDLRACSPSAASCRNR